MNDSLETQIARFAALAGEVAKGCAGADFCVAAEPAGWSATPLEQELRAALDALVKGLAGAPAGLDGAGVTRVLLALRQAEPARATSRADVGFGYTDFNSPLDSPLWDLRYRLRDAVQALRARGVDALAGADRAVLAANCGEFFLLLASPPGEAGRAKFRFNLDSLARLAGEIDEKGAEAVAGEIGACLRELSGQLDWDVREPKRFHYSDSGYSPSTHLGDQPNPDNLLWFFDAALLDRLLRALLGCRPLVVAAVREGFPRSQAARREAAQLVNSLKWSLVEMEDVGRALVAEADPALLAAPNGFGRTFGDFFGDRYPGELA